MPVISEDQNGPNIPILVDTLPARIAEPVFPHFFIEYRFIAPIVAKAIVPITPPQRESSSTLLLVALPITYIIKSISASTDIICPKLNPVPTHRDLFLAL